MGEHLAADIGAVLAGLLLAGLLVFVVLLARRWLLERGGGTVECSLRLLGEGRPGQWRLGIARYSRDELTWYAVFGIRLRPRYVMSRRALVVVDRRRPAGEEIAALSPDAAIVTLRERGERGRVAADGVPGVPGAVGGVGAGGRGGSGERDGTGEGGGGTESGTESGTQEDAESGDGNGDDGAGARSATERADGERTIELAMSSAALVGFLAWLEAAPPGFPVSHL